MAEYHYTVYFQPLPEGGYQAVFPAIPEIITFGSSLEEARAMAHDALRCHLGALMKDGEALPVEPRALGRISEGDSHDLPLKSMAQRLPVLKATEIVRALARAGFFIHHSSAVTRN